MTRVTQLNLNDQQLAFIATAVAFTVATLEGKSTAKADAWQTLVLGVLAGEINQQVVRSTLDIIKAGMTPVASAKLAEYEAQASRED